MGGFLSRHDKRIRDWMDSDEVVFAKRCVVGADAACVPDPLYATWWRSTVGVS